MEHATPTSADEWKSRNLIEPDEDDAETTDTLTDEPETTDEPPVEETPAEEPDESPQPDGETTADQADVGPAADAASETPQSTAEQPKIETRPLRVRVDGQDIDVPDAIETNDGRIVMTRESFNRVIQPRLTDRIKLHERHQKELAAERAKNDPAKNPVVLRAQLLTEEYDRLYEAGALQIDPDEYDKLQLRVENEILKRGVPAVPEASAEAEPSEQEINETRQVFEAGLNASLDALLKHETYKDLGLSKDLLYQLLRPRYAEWARIADEADPHGFEPGRKYVDNAAIIAVAEAIAGPIRAERKRLADVEAARRKNDAALGKTNVAPAAVTTAGSAAVGKRTKAPPKSREEWLSRIAEEEED